MSTIITPGALCFDIGAHHGESADKLINHYGAGRVISVEPSLPNYLKLVEHWREDARVVPIHAAVLEKPGFARISRAAAQDGLTTVDPDKWATLYPDAQFERPELVPAITLAMLEAEFGTPYYLKVDVEGVELSVLQGLAGKPRYLSFEFHGACIADALACMELLMARGYTHADFVEEDIELRTAPERPIAKVRSLLAWQQPNWGNITVG